MSLKNTIENYKKAKSIFIEIDEKFHALQSGEIDGPDVLNRLINRVNDFDKAIRGINLDDLKGNYPPEKIQAVSHNYQVFVDAEYYWSNFFLASKYAKSLRDPVMQKYIPGLDLDTMTLEKWGGERKLAIKFISAITHQDNIQEYENAIKRMAIGTMTQKEFSRIFDTVKHKMVPTPKPPKKVSESIPTFDEFMKRLDEDFFNPFDEDEMFKEKKPKHITDKGGPLALRKETFNLARVEFSKRPAGESTVIAKTQFAKGEIIEICPVIILGEEAKTIDSLKDVIFELDKDANEWALVLGYGSLYKHSDQPNTEYAYNKLTKQMYFITKRPVKHGEELTIDYGKDYWMQRTAFNTMTDEKIPEREPKSKPLSGKVNVKNESEVQPNSADIEGKNTAKEFAGVKNKANPVISGVAIIGTGQS